MKNKTQPPSNIPPPKSKETMKEDQFDEHVEHAIERIKETLQIKSKEYRRNNNPYHNFDQAAKADDVTPERALIGMMRKHEVSIRDIVNDIDEGKDPDLDVVAEKISDNINYLILLEGLIKRRVRQPGMIYNPEGVVREVNPIGGYVSDRHFNPRSVGEDIIPPVDPDRRLIDLLSYKEVTVSFDGGKTYMDLEEALKRGRDEE